MNPHNCTPHKQSDGLAAWLHCHHARTAWEKQSLGSVCRETCCGVEQISAGREFVPRTQRRSQQGVEHSRLYETYFQKLVYKKEVLLFVSFLVASMSLLLAQQVFSFGPFQ